MVSILPSVKWAALGSMDVKVAQNPGPNLRERSVGSEENCLWTGADFLIQNDDEVSLGCAPPHPTPHWPHLGPDHPLQSIRPSEAPYTHGVASGAGCLVGQ